MGRYCMADGVRGIEGDNGYGWTRLPDGRWVCRDENNDLHTLESRRRNPRDGVSTSGWHLYSDGMHGWFGEWCGSRILDAVDAAGDLIFGCGAVDASDWDACGKCRDCNPRTKES